ncbi:sensor histidine kinase [Glycomyces buryatensis]|nr:histidine kinase [Glycomyces buryatensis]
MSAKPSPSARMNRVAMRLLKIATVGGLVLTLLAEAFSGSDDSPMPMGEPIGWVQFPVALLAIAVFTLYRPGRKWWIAVVAFASIALTVLAMITNTDPQTRSIGVAESFAMLLLMLYAVRQWDASPGRWVAVVLGLAIVMIGFRYFTYPGSIVAGILMITMAMTTVIGFGAYLRSLDRLRRETQEEVRQAERLELAREMHDFVAHHVTGIVVLAQAAQVADTNPQKSFADIEEAGLAALASMRRMVTMLREPDSGGGTNPLGDLAQIEDLVERFSREGTDATCFISPELAGRVAPEIAATAHRVVREALTNVRKHARGAHRVRVVVAATGGQGLEVAVRDDGRAPGRLSGTGAGVGLVGLTERVEAVGGQLRAQPRTQGGWETVAWLPTEPVSIER